MFKKLKTKTFKNTQYFYKVEPSALRCKAICDRVVSRFTIFNDDDTVKEGWYPIPDELNDNMGTIATNPRKLLVDENYGIVGIADTNVEVGFKWDGKEMHKVDVGIRISAVDKGGEILSYTLPYIGEDAYVLKHEYIGKFLENSNAFRFVDGQIVESSYIIVSETPFNKMNIRREANSYIDYRVSRGIMVTVNNDEDEVYKFREYLNGERLALVNSKVTISLFEDLARLQKIQYTDSYGVDAMITVDEALMILKEMNRAYNIVDMIRKDINNRISNSKDVNNLDYQGIIDEYFNSYSHVFLG